MELLMIKYDKKNIGHTNVEKSVDITKINPFYFEIDNTPPILLSGHMQKFDININYTREILVELFKYKITEPATGKRHQWSVIKENLDGYSDDPVVSEILRKKISAGMTTPTTIEFELKLDQDDIITDYQYLYKVKVSLSEYETIYEETDYFMLLSRKSI